MAKAVIDHLVSECRIFYNDDAVNHVDPYQLSLNIIWSTTEPGAVTLSMHVGTQPHTRKTMKALVRALYEAGVRIVYADRMQGHVLPRGEQMPNGTWKLDLAKLIDRI